MGISDPCDDSFGVIALQQVKKWLEINPMGLSDPWADSLDIIALHTDKIHFQVLTQWALVSLGTTLL